MIPSPRRLAHWLAGLLMLPAVVTGCARSATRAGGPSSGPTQNATNAATVNASRSAASPTPAHVARVLAGFSPWITPDMDGETVQIAAAEIFFVHLGDGDRWTLSWSPPNAVVPREVTAEPRGSQGSYSIDTPGRTVVLTATGTSICPTPTVGALACTPGVSRTVNVTIVVGAADGPGITPNMDGETVQIAAAQVFLVHLGDGARWSLSWNPPNAVAQATSTVAPPPGSQGYFAIEEPGRTVVLTATGTSNCGTPTAGAPACTPGAPRTVTVTIVTVAGGGLSGGPIPTTTGAATASPSPLASSPSGPEVTHAVCPGALSAAAPISVRAGQQFTLALPANHPLFSYALLAPPDAAVVRLVTMTYLRDTATGGVTGLGGVECWTFAAVAPGRAALAFGIQHFLTPPPGSAPQSPDRLIDVTVQ